MDGVGANESLRFHQCDSLDLPVKHTNNIDLAGYSRQY